MILKFEEWLIDQKFREDFVGDLARVLNGQDIGHKSPRRKTDEHKKWADIIIGMAHPLYIDAFNQAWQEFLLEKQAAKESLE